MLTSLLLLALPAPVALQNSGADQALAGLGTKRDAQVAVGRHWASHQIDGVGVGTGEVRVAPVVLGQAERERCREH